MMRARDERGFTLIEVLLVCVVGMVVFGSTLTAFSSFYNADQAAQAQSDNVEDARIALGVAARQLRNLANPQTNPTLNATIYLAGSRDFIFQTSDPAKTWVRYCLDTTSAGATPEHAKLWMAESASSTLPSAMTGACGGQAAGVTDRVVSQNITNVANGMDRPVFTYSCLSGSPVSCPASSADYSKITMVGAQLYVDVNPKDHVREMQVSTAVFLRNQNQPPTVSVSGPYTLASHKVMLNGSGSSDPEGRTLRFHWYLDSQPPSAFDCSNAPQDNGDGATFTWDFGPTAQTGTSHTVWLVVCDPGGLFAMSAPQTVKVPA